MQNAKRSELVIGNVIKRILSIVREEYSATLDERDEEKEKKLEDSLQDTLDLFQSQELEELKIIRSERKEKLSLRESGMFRGFVKNEAQDLNFEDDYDFFGKGSGEKPAVPVPVLDVKSSDVKSAIVGDVEEWLEGLEGYCKQIAGQAINHIHSDEIIMTLGYSFTVKEFLVEAGAKRKIKVFVAESGPSYTGRKLALELAQNGIDTTLISDAAIFAIMARVNKVILGTNAVMADGGLVAQSGTLSVAMAAKTYKVPLIVCAALYKLSPVFPSDLDQLQDLKSPAAILPFEDLVGPMSNVEVFNPAWDYISPEFVSLYITNQGSTNPSYIYRSLADLYHTADY